MVSIRLRTTLKTKPGALIFYQIFAYSFAILLVLIFTRIEVFDFPLKTIIYPIAWIAFGLILYSFSKSLRGTGSAIRKTLVGIAFALYVFGTIFLGMQFAMCGEVQSGSKYVNREDDRLFLVCRTYECYQTVSECQFMEIITLLQHINWVTKVEKDRIDLGKWKRIDKYE